jgi:hypothetical protein
VLVGRRKRHPKRDAMVVGDEVLFAAGFAPVRRVRPDETAPCILVE